MRFPPERTGKLTEGGHAKPQPAAVDPTRSAPRQGRFKMPTHKPRPVQAGSAEHADVGSWHPGSGEVVPLPAGTYLDPEEAQVEAVLSAAEEALR